MSEQSARLLHTEEAERIKAAIRREIDGLDRESVVCTRFIHNYHFWSPGLSCVCIWDSRCTRFFLTMSFFVCFC